MTKYIITKDNRELRAYGTFARHEDIIRDNRLTRNDIIDEGYIVEGKNFSVYGNTLSDKLSKAREIESIYSYGYTKQGD